MFRNGHHQLHIVRKTHDGTIKLFSTTPQTKAAKLTWGIIRSCKFPVTAQNGPECYGLTNQQGSSFMFRKDQLEPSLWKNCRFIQMWMRLRSEGKEVELSKLISMLVSSKPFTLDPAKAQFDSDGLHVKHTGTLDEENLFIRVKSFDNQCSI